MECPNCHNIYNKNFKFCPYCGEKKPDPMVCPDCLSKYYEEYSFCPECGVELITKEEFYIIEEEKAIKKIEENRKNWKINQLKESNLNKEELDKQINQEINRIELSIDRDLEDENIKNNKQISLKGDKIDKIKFLKELPSIENRLNAVCINPGSNPCYFIRESTADEILEIIISNDELFLICKEDLNEVRSYFYDFYIYELDYDFDRQDVFDYLHDYFIDLQDSFGGPLSDYENWDYVLDSGRLSDYICDMTYWGMDFDSITGKCVLFMDGLSVDTYGKEYLYDFEEELLEFYPYYKEMKAKEEEEERKRREEEEKPVDKSVLLKHIEDNADRYIEYYGVDGYYDITKRINDYEIINQKTLNEAEDKIGKQIEAGTYKKVKELSEEEILEIKKKGLYCYIRDLTISAYVPTIKKAVQDELMAMVSNDELLYEYEIDKEKERLTKRELAKRNIHI